MKHWAKIHKTINRLTKDKDLRQDLWVAYLSGNADSDLTDSLCRAQLENELQSKIREKLSYFLQDPDQGKQMTDILDNFSDFEQSIICLIYLGFDANKIALYKSYSLTRVRQAIRTIEDNSIWSEL